jgi:UDP-N-acetylmuramyl tripeptide synthase
MSARPPTAGRRRDPARSAAALAVGRGAAGLSQALGRGSGTMIGGRLALRLDPGVLATVARGRQSVLVTGTNGKSTVTALVAAALSAVGPVVTNSTGANMPDGIVTALADDRTSPLAAIEVDEVYLGPVVAATGPRAVVALNAYREYTRGVSLAATLAHWRAAAEDLPQDGVAIFNVDDPLVCWAFESAPRCVGVAGGLGWREDAELCPACGAVHEWAGQRWSCPGCGRSRPDPDWRVTRGPDGAWSVAGPRGEVAVRVTVPGRTGPIGAAFALAAADALEADMPAAARALGEVVDVDGRYRPFPVGQRSARLLMLKNPAGWAEAIDLAVAERLPLAIAVDPFGPKDTTTMWEAPFERLAGRTIPVTGGRAADAVAVLDAAGVAATEAADPAKAVQLADQVGAEIDEVIVACNYPAFRRLSRTFRAGAP